MLINRIIKICAVLFTLSMFAACSSPSKKLPEPALDATPKAEVEQPKVPGEQPQQPQQPQAPKGLKAPKGKKPPVKAHNKKAPKVKKPAKPANADVEL